MNLVLRAKRVFFVARGTDHIPRGMPPRNGSTSRCPFSLILRRCFRAADHQGWLFVPCAVFKLIWQARRISGAYSRYVVGVFVSLGAKIMMLSVPLVTYVFFFPTASDTSL